MKTFTFKSFLSSLQGGDRGWHLLPLFLALLCCASIQADDFSVDGLYYSTLSDNTVQVVKPTSGKYTGEITIPQTVSYNATDYTVVAIGEAAFQAATNVTSVTLPTGITSIGAFAFNDCTGLTAFSLPASITSIGERAFYYCDNIKDLYAYSEDPSSYNAGSLAFSKIHYGSHVCTLHVPTGCTAAYAADATFSVFTQVVEFDLPKPAIGGNCGKDGGDNLKWSLDMETGVLSFEGTGEMGDYSDAGAPWYDYVSAITLIDWGTATPTTIGEYAFYSCSALTEIDIPNSVKVIGDNAFRYCSSLTKVTIGKSVNTIGDKAFYKCHALKSVTIPSSVTSIGEGAFWDCSALTSVEIGNSVTSIGYAAFLNCYALTSVTIPSSVTSIGGYAFSGCSALTSVEIGNSVTTIGDYAFSDCSALTAINVADDNTAYSSENGVLFDKAKTTLIQCPCGKAGDYTIPSSVTTIGNYAFFNCDALTSVTIPSSVTSIGDYAFGNCYDLKVVNNYATEPQVITADVFDNLTPANIKLHVVKGYKDAYNAAEVWKEFGTITDDLKPINPSGNCGKDGDNLTWLLDLETGVLAISGTGAMADYLDAGAPWYDYVSAITLIDWGTATPTTIGNSAFYGCEKLTSVTIPSSVTTIGESAFSDCYALTAVTIPSSVTTIGDYAFYNCTALTSVTIPSSVTSIGKEAFFYCYALTAINVADDNTAYSSENGVLFDKAKTTLIQCPCGKAGDYTIPSSVTTIGESAFYGCEKLTSVTIPSSVTSIGDKAFAYCYALTSVTIPNSVTTIGKWAFCSCEKLTSVEIGNSVTSIGEGAFSFCKALTSVTIPSSVTSIGEEAFSYCTALTSVTIPSSVKTIGEYAFGYCNDLKVVNNYATEPQVITANVFYNLTPANITLHVVKGYKDAYKAAEVWKEFGMILEDLDAPTAIDPINSSSLQGGDRGRLILRNGQIFILRGDQTYTVTGQELK